MPTSLLVSFLTHLKWVLDFLTRHVFFHHRVFGSPEDHHVGGGMTTVEEVECGVCSRRIEDDDEMRESRCNHFFHRHCLDVWMECRRMTCPLCHGSLVAPPKIGGGGVVGGGEVLYFDYCRVNSDGDYGSWWLR